MSSQRTIPKAKTSAWGEERMSVEGTDSFHVRILSEYVRIWGEVLIVSCVRGVPMKGKGDLGGLLNIQ